MADPNVKRDQLSLSQYEELRAKQGKKKLIPNFPIPVLLIFTIPLAIFIALFLGYIFYIRGTAAQ